MVKKYLTKIAGEKLLNAINSLKAWLLIWIKEWTYKQINGTEIITDNNWRDYIGWNGDTKVFKNLSFATVYTLNDIPTTFGDDIWTINYPIISLKRSVRNIQFATEHINLSGLTIYPPDCNLKDLTKNNGYRITLFILPTSGIDVYSAGDLKNSGNKYIPRVISIGINIDEEDKKAVWYGGLYENQFSVKDYDPGNYTWGIKRKDSTYDETLQDYYVKGVFGEEYSTTIDDFKYGNIIGYGNYTVEGRGRTGTLKPGRVVELMWFNGFWYIMGAR